MIIFRFSWALLALAISCSPDSQEESTKLASLDTVSSQKILNQWDLQTFEDQSFIMSAIADEWTSSELIEIKSKPKLGNITFKQDQESWVYTPNQDMSGEDKFDVIALDKTGLPKLFSVNIKIIEVNDSPVAENLTLRLPEDSVIEFSIPLSDPEQDDLILEVRETVSKGTLLNEQNTRKFTYKPNQNISGVDQFKYSISDGLSSSQGTITFEILSVKDKIVASDGLFQMSSSEMIDGNISWVDPDNSNSESMIKIMKNPDHGRLEVDPKTGAFKYIPSYGYNGFDHFEYEVIKDNRKSNRAKISFKIDHKNQAPYPCQSHTECKPADCTYDDPSGCNDDHTDHEWDQIITCPRVGPCQGKIIAFDPDKDHISYKLSQHPSFGEISNWDQHNGTFTFTPQSHNNHLEYDEFTFWLEDCYRNKSRTYKVKIEFEKSWTFLKDSFEREHLFSQDPGFHWRFMLDDNGRGITESGQECKNQVCAKIFSEHDGFGPMADKDSALFFFGREGQSTHELFMISKNFDLQGYHDVEISFSFLPVDIGDKDVHHHYHPHGYNHTPDEYLKVEVCLAGDYECGLSPVDPHRLKSSVWQTVYTHNGQNNGFDGRHHQKHDWISENIQINLDHLEAKHDSCFRSNFVMRFSSRMQDGFEHNQFHKSLKDAVLIDGVELKAK